MPVFCPRMSEHEHARFTWSTGDLMWLCWLLQGEVQQESRPVSLLPRSVPALPSPAESHHPRHRRGQRSQHPGEEIHQIWDIGEEDPQIHQQRTQCRWRQTCSSNVTHAALTKRSVYYWCRLNSEDGDSGQNTTWYLLSIIQANDKL